ncbi:MAG TPA: hypothetical protein VFX11_10005, partial [Candidatus Kapabacteria bacterium]|nr:hypothetical protein [Candidatus Kapabacteria bacterium]
SCCNADASAPPASCNQGAIKHTAQKPQAAKIFCSCAAGALMERNQVRKVALCAGRTLPE